MMKTILASKIYFFLNKREDILNQNICGKYNLTEISTPIHISDIH